MFAQKFDRWWLLALLGFFSLFFVQQINLTAADLGRHLKNGQVILETGQVFATNYYSYTHPDFPVLNHHWLFGVISYGLFQLGGFVGLSVVNVAFNTLAFGLVVGLAFGRYKKAALVVGLLLLPTITPRHEYRPEVFSLLLVALEYVLLERYARGRLAFKWLAGALLLLQVIWVNTHIFFVLSLSLVGIWWLRAVLAGNRQQLGQLTLLGLGLSLISLLNPAGVAGLLAPFQIFTEYGYRVAENQSVWFMLNKFPQSRYFYFPVVAGLGLLSFWPRWRKESFKQLLPDLLLYLVYAAAGLKMIRMFSFFGIVGLPILAHNLSLVAPSFKKNIKPLLNCPGSLLLASPLAFALAVFAIATHLFFPFNPAFGLGLMPSNERSIEFFRKAQIQGPIYNNYDIGGFLIWELFPQDRVFVDNRPEAYPANFFQEQVVGPQENDAAWQDLLNHYQFNVIYFYRHDFTNWGQQFLVTRIQDPAWVPVFVDDYTIIFVRNVEKNAAVIEQYALPKELFQVGQ